MATILKMQGHLHQSDEQYRQALELAIAAGRQLLPVVAGVYSGLSRLSYEWDQLEAALEYAQKTFEFGRKWGDADIMVIAHVMMARIRQAHGDLPGAEESFRSAESILHSRQIVPTGVDWLGMSHIWLWLAQGNLEACNRWVRENDIQLTDQPGRYDAEKRLIQARILLAEKKPDVAMKILSHLLAENESAGH